MVSMISVFLKFTEVHSVAWLVICPGECSVCTWKKCTILLLLDGMFSVYLNTPRLMFHLKPVFPYWFFCWMMFIDIRVLKSPINIVLLSISCFISVDISCMFRCFYVWCIYVYNYYILFLGLTLGYSVMSLLSLVTVFVLKSDISITSWPFF